MSKTDNTRPFLLQWGDTTVPGGPRHYHSGEPCDFHPDNNVHNYRLDHRLNSAWRAPHNLGDERKDCVRIAHAYGGKWSLGKQVKRERKFRRRNIRQRERMALKRVAQSDFTEDFDLLPIREDRRTIYFDLT